MKEGDTWKEMEAVINTLMEQEFPLMKRRDTLINMNQKTGEKFSDF